MYTYGAHDNIPPSDTIPGTYVKTTASGWTAGFFPDSIWHMYHRAKQTRPSHRQDATSSGPTPDEWLTLAHQWTAPLTSNANLTTTHDLGFLAKPFESALRFNNETHYLPILAQMSSSLAARFVPEAGVIRSWDNKNTSFSQNASHQDSVLVTIDNMMNLALLARSAAEYTGNATMLEMAISHANRTRDHHFRPDGSTFHVCDYSGTTGDLYLCRTAQGLADNSTWARGQAWGIYGFAEMYSFVQDPSYLATAVKAADWFLDHLPEDGVPFWDFDAPRIPDVTPRDSSAAMIAASGMILLQDQIDRTSSRGPAKDGRGERRSRRRNYPDAAIKLLHDTLDLTLAGQIGYADIDKQHPASTLGATTDPTTPANTSVSRGFEAILMHATANNNPSAGDERNFDTGLLYGDYYLIEAGDRLGYNKCKEFKLS